MYLGKEKMKYQDGIQYVFFCEDCGSQDIEIVKTCKQCGSHNVKKPSYNILSENNDKRGIKTIYKEKEVPMYQCDSCGAKFSGIEDDNIITFDDGEFCAGSHCDEYYSYGTEFTLPMDLCSDCRNKLISKLNNDINNITKQEYIENTLKELFKK